MKLPTDKQLEKLWSEAVKERAGRICEKHKGKCSGYLHAHHIFGKRGLAARTDLKNGVCVCGGTHKFWFHNQSTVLEAMEWAIKLRNTSKEYLSSLSKKGTTLNRWNVESRLKSAIKKYKKEQKVIGSRI